MEDAWLAELIVQEALRYSTKWYRISELYALRCPSIQGKTPSDALISNSTRLTCRVDDVRDAPLGLDEKHGQLCVGQ